MTVTLTRTVRFSARHRLARPDWSAERNREVFGPVAEPHAHDFACAVTVAGPIEGRMGMIVDLALLDRVLAEEVLGPLDGRDLGDAVPAFARGEQLQTCEALAAHLYDRIRARLPEGVRLERVRIQEDPTLYADCTGPS